MSYIKMQYTHADIHMQVYTRTELLKLTYLELFVKTGYHFLQKKPQLTTYGD